MLSTTDILKALCPSLYADGERDIFIQIATEELSSGFFGTSYSRAVALKAAHVFILSQRTLGESGTVSNKSEGGLSIGYANAKQISSNDDLDQTHYGKQLINLVRQRGPQASVTGRPELYTNPEISAEEIANQAIND